ncbi:MAG: DUF1444 family protein [Mycobacterium leprae]
MEEMEPGSGRLMEKEFAELRDKLYPMLMDPVQIQEKGQGQILNGPLAEGLFVIYGIEESDDRIRYVTYQDLRDWGVSHTTVHVTAVRNLERKTEGHRFTMLNTPDGTRPMFIWHLEDGYDAARILLPIWLEEFADAIDGDLVIGVPHRNWLVAIGDADEQLVQAVRHRVQAEHHSAEFPVSPFLYVWREGQLARYLKPKKGQTNVDND